MKQYLMSIYQPDGDAPPELLDRVMRELDTLNAEIRTAGAWVFSGGLHPPSTATVVRAKDGDVLTTDGPYLEGKEQFVGYIAVDCESLERAIEIAAEMPGADLTDVEIRPIMHGGTADEL